jgi:large subunit ribosomal protein L18
MRIRKKLSGTSDRPRMSIMISHKQMYVQFIDDDSQVTLASASTVGQDGKCNVETARLLGQRAAKQALDKGIRRVVIDRGGFKFHGRVQALVAAAMEAGLESRTQKNPPATQKAAPDPEPDADGAPADGAQQKEDQ